MSACLQLQAACKASNGKGLPAVSCCLQLVSDNRLETRSLLSPTVSSLYRRGDKETSDTRRQL